MSLKGKPFTRFIPGNNEDANAFDERFCSFCERDRSFRGAGIGGCSIISQALFNVKGAPEWTHDAKGNARCTGYWEIGGDPPAPINPADDPAQLRLFNGT